jgi:hypothetical protein
MANGDFFTRATWRPGKRHRMRKRVKPWGGKITAPAAFLEAAKLAAFRPGRPGYRVCHATKRDGTPCGRLALRDMKVCGAHGGYSVLAHQGKLQPSGRSAAAIERRAAAVEDRTPPPTTELSHLHIYKHANQWVRMRLIRAWGTPAWPTLVKQLRTQQAI